MGIAVYLKDKDSGRETLLNVYRVTNAGDAVKAAQKEFRAMLKRLETGKITMFTREQKP